MESDLEEDIEQMERGILNVRGLISGMIGGLRADVGFSVRTQDNADDIIAYLTAIDTKLDLI